MSINEYVYMYILVIVQLLKTCPTLSPECNQFSAMTELHSHKAIAEIISPKQGKSLYVYSISLIQRLPELTSRGNIIFFIILKDF